MCTGPTTRPKNMEWWQGGYPMMATSPFMSPYMRPIPADINVSYFQLYTPLLMVIVESLAHGYITLWFVCRKQSN